MRPWSIAFTQEQLPCFYAATSDLVCFSFALVEKMIVMC